VNWLEHWKRTEPLRLYLYGIVVPLLGAAVVYGLLTTEQLTAWLAVAGAALLGVGALERARSRHLWAPASVERETDAADDRGYAEGLEDGTRRGHLEVRTASAEELEQVLARDPQPATAHMASLGRCRNVEGGHRCVLPPHPQGVGHRYE
jgi:hypothetical protein